MSFYIGRYGHIYEYGGKAEGKEAPLDTTDLGFTNSFEDRERAIYFRDKLRNDYPAVFTYKNTKKKSSKPMSQDDFRAEMRKGVSDHMDDFWTKLDMVSPKDYVDGFLKAAAFGFSRAPSAKEVDEEEKQKQLDKERQRKEELISRGIQIDDLED